MRPDWVDREEFPFTSRIFRVNGHALACVDEGEGTPLLMLHGNPTWSFMYRYLIRHLCDDYRCIAPDYIGFGLSDKPMEWDYRVSHHAEMIHRLIRTLQMDRFFLVVHDWGGPIGFRYALQFPEQIAGMVITNTWMWRVDQYEKMVLFSRVMGSPIGKYLITRLNVFPKIILPSVVGKPKNLLVEHYRHYTAPFSVPSQRHGVWMFPREILSAGEWLKDLWESRHLLTDIPKLFLWGMRDPAFTRRVLNRWIRTFPEAAVYCLDDIGHYVPEEAKERLVPPIRRFLKRQSRSDNINHHT